MQPVSRLRHTGYGACLVALFFCAEPAFAATDQLPDADLLEFLGKYETSNGKAIDPLQFADDKAPQKKQTTTTATTKDERKQSTDRKKLLKDGRYEK